MRLRPWQRAALDQLAASSGTDFLAVATPGAGKTTFALVAAAGALRSARQPRLVVVAPTAHLKTQWAAAGVRVGLVLDPAWRSRRRLPRDVHGVVVTYQQVASDADALRPLADGAVAVLDELHHAGDERAWGEGLRVAFADADRRIALSGTPFRSDVRAIPFVRYEGDEAVPDYEYGYGDALADGGVVRPVYFPRINGEMEWAAPDGAVRSATFTDHVDREAASQRLRTALSLDGDWLPTVLDRAVEQLRLARRTQPDAGGLVIAADQDHARGIASLLRARCGTEPSVATSDDPDASSHIARFADGSDEWIVAVRMVSEGVDIPRLRVGVYATTTTTELFFRQAVGRLVRWTPGVTAQRAWLFIPDDVRLRTWAAAIAEQRRHSLRRRREAREDAPAEQPVMAGADEQLSLFTAISAVALDAPAIDALDEEADALVEAPAADDLLVEVWPPPLGGGDGADALAEVPRHERVALLRAANAERASLLAQISGMPHAAVNRELNRRAGIRRIDEATVAQLQARLVAADAWLRRA